MKTMTIILFLIFPTCYSQGKDSIFTSETNKLLSYVRSTLGTDSEVDLDPKPYDWIDERCHIYRSSEFSESEQMLIQQELKNPKITRWNKSFFKSGLIINEEEWINTVKNSKRGFISFSSPIFLREYSVCVLTYEYGYGGNGFGSTAIYKKQNGEWTQLGSNCSWDNN
jgi:hypothetical protein